MTLAPPWRNYWAGFSLGNFAKSAWVWLCWCEPHEWSLVRRSWVAKADWAVRSDGASSSSPLLDFLLRFVLKSVPSRLFNVSLISHFCVRKRLILVEHNDEVSVVIVKRRIGLCCGWVWVSPTPQTQPFGRSKLKICLVSLAAWMVCFLSEIFLHGLLTLASFHYDLLAAVVFSIRGLEMSNRRRTPGANSTSSSTGTQADT